MATENNSGTGMCIPNSVRQTPDKGRGVFAEADIPAGTRIWRHVPGQYEVFDQAILEQRLAGSSHDDAVYLLTHIVSMDEFPGFMVNVLDEGALINHADQPNVIRKCSADEYQGGPATSPSAVAEALQSDHFDLVAARDITRGEELLMDYNDEPDDPDYYEAACERYAIDWEWME